MEAKPISRTALITGATSGIGAAFARQLAAEGYALVLHGRRKEVLDALAEELRSRFGVAVEVWLGDLSEAEVVQSMAAKIEKLDNLELLVSNAGYGTMGYFADLDVEHSMEMVKVHIEAPTRFTRAALPGMIARGRGGIINVSSVAAFTPMHGNVLYSATKVYLNNFSAALQRELKGTGVRVQALCPGFTHTQFHDRPEIKVSNVKERIPGWAWMDAEDVAKRSLRALRRGVVIYVPGLIYKLIVLAARLGLVDLFMAMFGSQVKKMRLGE